MLTGTVGAERTFLGAGMGVVVLYLRRGGIVGETLQEEKKCSITTPIVKFNVLQYDTLKTLAILKLNLLKLSSLKC